MPEHQHVFLTLEVQSVEEKPAVENWTEPVDERRGEMQWLARESAFYAGEWVAHLGCA